MQPLRDSNADIILRRNALCPVELRGQLVLFGRLELPSDAYEATVSPSILEEHEETGCTTYAL